mmetsp:Transcript_24578/g.49111  ORF Transcript_24578/g.49111 Transcript_24578/m.49111 type:complete len:96 (-) Transcript_24578:120-407(-)
MFQINRKANSLVLNNSIESRIIERKKGFSVQIILKFIYRKNFNLGKFLLGVELYFYFFTFEVFYFLVPKNTIRIPIPDNYPPKVLIFKLTLVFLF